MRKQNILTSVVIIAMLILVAVMTYLLFPILRDVLQNVHDEAVMVEFIYSHGFRGVPVLLGMLILQVIVPFIPSVAIQLLTGLCYGVWWGILINIVGIVMGNTLVFFAVRQSQNLLAPFFKKEHTHHGPLNIKNLSRLNNPERIVFFCFLIPGFPNGFAPYIFAQTKVPFHKYIAAVIAGSIPSSFMATFLGDRISQGNHVTAIILGIVIVLVVILVLIFKKRLMALVFSNGKER